jgi:uncharacterized membrane protein YoaK (UPF0700 family)
LVELSPTSQRPVYASSSSIERSNLLLHSAVLSGVAGYVDAAGFVALLGLFPAHLTGELVGDAIAFSSGHPSAHAHLWAFPVFVGSVTLATLVARLLRHHGLKARSGLLALVTLALAMFSSSDALAWLLHEGQLPALVRGGFAVAAMGFQSALMRESLTGSCPTTVMTGNLTQVVIDIVDHVVGRIATPLASTKSRIRLTPVASALCVFAASAALGGWLTRLYGSASVALPTLLTAWLMVQAWQEDVAQRAAKHGLVTPLPIQRVPVRPRVVASCAAERRTSDAPLEPCLAESAEHSSETRIKAVAEQPRARGASGVRRIRIAD